MLPSEVASVRSGFGELLSRIGKSDLLGSKCRRAVTWLMLRDEALNPSLVGDFSEHFACCRDRLVNDFFRMSG